MKVKELIAELSKHDPESMVVMQQPVHDYIGTLAAVRPAMVGRCMIIPDRQHNGWRRVTDEELNPDSLLYISEEEIEQFKSVILISDCYDL